MGVSLLVMLNSMTLLRYKNKIKELTPENFESHAKLLICKQCKTKEVIPNIMEEI
ncbi:MAG: hypothetical protein BAJALOKI1v1_2010009 [Promethearchaeota archaeon]|nr:MAG: hypothetical protein BAJALOKI1v1_2010009 [Candidatus Lokiarchaeota archaeon]